MKTMRWLTLIAGIILTILGVVMLGTPGTNLVALSIFICATLFISGVLEIIAYFSFPSELRSGWLLASGILTTLLGAWLLFSNYGVESLLFTLPIVFPIWLLVTSIMYTVDAYQTRALGNAIWGWNLFIGIVGIIAGFLLMFDPVTSALTISYTMAFIFIYRGISDIVFFFSTKNV